jgi:hypothetical protein
MQAFSAGAIASTGQEAMTNRGSNFIQLLHFHRTHLNSRIRELPHLSGPDPPARPRTRATECLHSETRESSSSEKKEGAETP